MTHFFAVVGEIVAAWVCILAASAILFLIGAWLDARRAARAVDCPCGCDTLDVYDQDAWTEDDDTAVEQMMRGRWT